MYKTQHHLYNPSTSPKEPSIYLQHLKSFWLKSEPSSFFGFQLGLYRSFLSLQKIKSRSIFQVLCCMEWLDTLFCIVPSSQMLTRNYYLYCLLNILVILICLIWSCFIWRYFIWTWFTCFTVCIVPQFV